MMKRCKVFGAIFLASLLLLGGCAKPAEETRMQETTAAGTAMMETAASEETTAAGAEAAEEEIFTFTDSLGREVVLPRAIDRVAVSGPLAQIYLYAFAPEKLVGIAREWDEDAKRYIPEDFHSMPVLGQLYGGKGELNKEELLLADPQVVIDIGEPKEGMAQDLDDLQEQTGIPFVHIEAHAMQDSETFTHLGTLLSEEARGKEFTAYLTELMGKVRSTMDAVGDNRKRLIYIVGDEGKNIIAAGSYHGQVFDYVGENIALVDEPSSKGSGNEVDMEYILGLDPDIILFAPFGVYGTAGEEAAWKQMRAIQEGEYFEAPHAVYNWLGFPPSVQRYLGLLWMSELFYPEESDIDLKEETKTFYDMFYHVSLSDEQYEEIVKNSLRR